jgi:hypothetical protein
MVAQLPLTRIPSSFKYFYKKFKKYCVRTYILN